MKINKLHIYSKDLENQFDFYTHQLNLATQKVSPNKVEIQLGYSVLQIEEDPNFKPYHIAFHISDQMEKEALTWLKERVPILKMKEEEIIDFSSWNAKSIYFYDADRNIIEFISREHLFPSKSDDFSKKEIQGIAEIGLAVKNVHAVFNQIHQQTGLVQYFGDLEKFCVIGDDEELLITVDQTQKTWFPTSDKSRNAAFKMEFEHQQRNIHFHYDGQKILIQEIKA